MNEPYVITDGLFGHTVTCTDKAHADFKYWAATHGGAESLGREHVAEKHAPAPTRVHLRLRDRCLGVGVVASCSNGDWVDHVFSHADDAHAAWAAHARVHP